MPQNQCRKTKTKEPSRMPLLNIAGATPKRLPREEKAATEPPIAALLSGLYDYLRCRVFHTGYLFTF